MSPALLSTHKQNCWLIVMPEFFVMYLHNTRHKIFPRELFVYSSPYGWRLSPERRKMENNQSKHGKVGDRAEHRRTRALKQFKDQKPEHAFALRKR